MPWTEGPSHCWSCSGHSPWALHFACCLWRTSCLWKEPSPLTRGALQAPGGLVFNSWWQMWGCSPEPSPETWEFKEFMAKLQQSCFSRLPGRNAHTMLLFLLTHPGSICENPRCKKPEPDLNIAWPSPAAKPSLGVDLTNFLWSIPV